MDDRLGLTARQRDAIPQLGVGPVTVGASLGPLTRLGIDAPCGALVVVDDPDELRRLIRWTRRERLPLTPLAPGTERVVRGGGIAGVVVVLGAGFATVTRAEDHVTIGGAADASFLAEHGVAELLVPGVPTVAGCLDQLPPGRAAQVAGLALLLGKGVMTDASPEGFALRRLGLRDEAVVIALRVRAGPPAPPPTEVFPGIALFEDPPQGSSAGELLERCGLLGVRIRGARIDPDHPNRIVAATDATARDVSVLVDWAAARIAAEWGVSLTPAVRMVGTSIGR